MLAHLKTALLAKYGFPNTPCQPSFQIRVVCLPVGEVGWGWRFSSRINVSSESQQLRKVTDDDVKWHFHFKTEEKQKRWKWIWLKMAPIFPQILRPLFLGWLLHWDDDCNWLIKLCHFTDTSIFLWYSCSGEISFWWISKTQMMSVASMRAN